MGARVQSAALICRLAELDRPECEFSLDGVTCVALEGDTVLTAVLTQRASLRQSEFSGQARAGFCWIGACQDCWVWLQDGSRIRACSTLVQAGMAVRTSPPPMP